VTRFPLFQTPVRQTRGSVTQQTDVLNEVMNPQSLVQTILHATWNDLQRENEGVPLSLFDESVFRWLFIRAALRLRPDLTMQIEWKQIDLLIQDGDDNHLVEFKFWCMPRHHYHLDKTRGPKKGGPGKQNLREFWDNVEKLATLNSKPWRAKQSRDGGAIASASLILAFAHPKIFEGKTYRDWYLDRPKPDPKGREGIADHLGQPLPPPDDYVCPDGNVMKCILFPIV
jgi:hypothetical protein